MRKLRAYKKTVSIVNERATDMYENLVGKRKGFLLESYDKNYDRHTFMGEEPEEMITSEGQSLVIRKKDGSCKVRRGNPLELLKAYYDEFEIVKDYEEPGFSGGLVGNLGYDFIRYVEEIPDHNPDEIGIGTVQLMLVTRFIVVDHEAETLSAIVLEADNPDGKEKAMEIAQDLIGRARGEKQTPRNEEGKAPATEEKTVETEENVKKAEKEDFRDGRIVGQSDTSEQYGRKVERIKEYIRQGDIFQTVLSQRWVVETGRDGFDLYKELRELNPSPYLYYFQYGDFEVIGSSPEMLVKQKGGQIYTCPIAGTRKRGRDEEEDQRLQQELLEDEKERAEHVMLVDLARNDMGRVSEFGTVKVTRFMEVQNYSHVMHMVSMVEGKKKGSYHPLDLAASFLPAGTLSGAPKIRAMEIIEELEETRRGLYGGATGYIDFSGDMDLCITIRTMVKKEDRVYLQAGAGIVADSVPEKEYEECRNKVMALAKTLMGKGEQYDSAD